MIVVCANGHRARQVRQALGFTRLADAKFGNLMVCVARDQNLCGFEVDKIVFDVDSDFSWQQLQHIADLRARTEARTGETSYL